MTRKGRPPEDDRVEDDGSERKERVIHTRVPERLENELRERAGSLGISVSNLVRNVLGHAFGLVGDIMADGASVARAARGERASERPGAGAVAAAAAAAAVPDPNWPLTVLAWQPIVMAMNTVCAICNAVLVRGADAALGVVEDGRARPVVCPTCLEEIRHGDARDARDASADHAQDGPERPAPRRR